MTNYIAYVHSYRCTFTFCIGLFVQILKFRSPQPMQLVIPHRHIPNRLVPSFLVIACPQFLVMCDQDCCIWLMEQLDQWTGFTIVK